MTTTRLRLISSLPLLLLLLPFVFHLARASSISTAEINSNSDTDMRPSFPAHWGPPPLALTRDLVQLPGEYGRGSGTLRRWISEKMAEDDANAAASTKSATDGKLWPGKTLVGLMGDEAKAAILAGNSELLSQNIHVLPHDAVVTEDYREDRVRVYVGEDGKVVREPEIG